jgi:hypothetical protein
VGKRIANMRRQFLCDEIEDMSTQFIYLAFTVPEKQFTDGICEFVFF